MSTSRTERIELNPDVIINIVISEPHKPDALEQRTRPTIVFLHFWGGSACTWSLVTPRIVEAGYRTIAPDFRGWGNSTGPEDPSRDAYSIATLAGDVETIIDRLGLKRVVLVGLSMGAKVAQLVASRSHPEVVGLVLMSPAPTTPLRLPPDMREQQIHAYDNSESAAFVAKNVLTTSFQAQNTALPDFVVEDMVKGNEWARAAWPAYAMEENVTNDAERLRISVPVLVLAAEKDVVEPQERVRKQVVERILNAKLKILPGSGHLSPLDAPEAVVENLIQFLKEG